MQISPLFLVIGFKIVVSLILVGLPFLLLKKDKLELIAGVKAQSDTFFRLYGIAILALLVGYGSAFPLLLNGQFPWAVAIMGAISNGGATFILLRGDTALAKRVFAPIFGFIFAALIWSMFMPGPAIAPLF